MCNKRDKWEVKKLIMCNIWGDCFHNIPWIKVQQLLHFRDATPAANVQSTFSVPCRRLRTSQLTDGIKMALLEPLYDAFAKEYWDRRAHNSSWWCLNYCLGTGLGSRYAGILCSSHKAKICTYNPSAAHLEACSAALFNSKNTCSKNLTPLISGNLE